MQITNDELIKKASSIVKPIEMRHGFTTADCGCALVTDKGNIYLGVSIDTPSSMGFCAEHSAIANMITNQEFKIAKIVAAEEDVQFFLPVVDAESLYTKLVKII